VTNVTIRDESMSGETLREIIVQFPSETITVRELIRSRVYQGVRESNARAAAKKAEPVAIVPLTATELTLNGPRAKNSAPVNWQARFEQAVEAFQAKRIMILVDDRQVNSLEEQIQVRSTTRISFLRLTMLMGG
jgi:hypothetical protein